MSDAEIVAIRDAHLPSEGEAFDCVAFAHFSAINMPGFKTLREGQKVSFDSYQGPKCKMANNITVLAPAGERAAAPASAAPNATAAIGECDDAVYDWAPESAALAERWRALIEQQARELAELREEFAKAERLWKQAEIARERAETTLGGMKNALRITLARVELDVERIVAIDGAAWMINPRWDEEFETPTGWEIRGRMRYGSNLIAFEPTLRAAIDAAREAAQ